MATTTEIYDYLRVLFARAGTPHCWECGREISSQTPSQIVDAVMKNPAGTKVMILSPLVRGQKGEHKETFGAIHKQGFVRARVDGEMVELNAGRVSGVEEDVQPHHRSDGGSDCVQAGDAVAVGGFGGDGARSCRRGW